MIVKNAKIITMEDNGIIENGYVIVNDGIITDIGIGDPDTTDTEIIDACGCELYPGFIDAHCHLGLWEDGLGFEGNDGNEDTDPCTPHLRAIDSINPMDKCFSEALAAGITTVIAGPGSSNPIGGQMVAMKTYGRRMEDMIIKTPFAIKFALGENPKTCFNGRDEAPTTRMAIVAIIREQLAKAKKYLDGVDLAKEDEETEPPEYDIKCEALIPLLKREIPAHFHAHRSDDIFTAIRISKEFNLDFRIVHATEAYLIADELREDNVSVIIGPIICDRSKPELKQLTEKNATILKSCGVSFAICTDHPVIPAQYLALSTSIAVEEGLDRESALRAITIDCAKLLGIENRVGSIKIGKDADMVVFDCDPLSGYKKPKIVIAGGKVILK